jgi:hypothetical protein
MQIGDEKEISIEDFFKIVDEDGIYEIETPDGWMEIGDVYNKKNKNAYILRTNGGLSLGCSDDHLVMSKNKKWKSAEDIVVGKDSVLTETGLDKVIAKEYIGIKDTYDIEVKSNAHSYYSNHIVSHNTGKTSLAKAIGQHLDLPIHFFDISGMSNYEFCKEWSNMLGSTPCIALIEDVDAVFNGRENVRNRNNNLDLLTFDCFLNCIDGVQNTDGLFLIVTTNRVELLDEALGKPRTDKDPNGTNISTRPGRIDRAFELKKLDKDCRIKIAKRILSDCPEFIDKIVEKGEGDSPAQFVERLTQVALKHFWDNKDLICSQSIKP